MHSRTSPAQPLRILLVITKATWGGAQQYVYDLATTFHHQGDVVHVAYGTTGQLAEHLQAAQVPTFSIPGLVRDVSFGAEVRAFWALCAHLRATTPDVVHTNSSKAGILAALAARICGVRRIVFTAHGWAYNEKRPLWQKALIALIHWCTVLLADVTICVSPAVMRDAAWMPFVQSRLVLIRNGRTTEPLLPRPEARAHLVSATDTTDTWIGTVAELHPTKNIDVLIDAFALIADTTDTRLVVIGEGHDRPRLEARIHEHRLAERIHLVGFIPHAARYLAAFDIFVLPSHTEALGYVLLEAGHARLPVIATRVGGIPDIITHRKTGLLVPPGHAPALADSLRALLADPTTQQRLAAALHTHVTTTFAPAAMYSATRAQYD